MTSSPLNRAIDAIAVPGVAIAYRLITEGDEFALLAKERPALAASVPKVQRASGAARIAARHLLSRLGHPECAIPKSETGAPVWPAGIVGSLAHDSTVAVAALAQRPDFLGLGIDVEPAEPLDPDSLHIVATSREIDRIQGDLRQGRLIFSIKEAVYKAVHPIDGVFLDHHDVEVDLVASVAGLSTGRSIRFKHGVTSHIIALAFL